MSWSFSRRAALLALGVGAALVSPRVGYAGGGVPAGGATGGMPVITVFSRHFQVQAPAAFTAGFVSVKYVSNGGVWSSAGLIRLKPGASVQQLLNAYRSGNDALAGRLGVSLGAVGGPGGPQLISNLQPGQYVVGDIEQTVKHTFIVAGRGFTVLAGTGQQAPAPTATVGVDMVNFKFHMPSAIPAGRDTFRLMNSGTQPHEMGLFKLAPGKTMADVVAFLKSQKGQPPGSFAGGLFDLDPGQTSYLVQAVAPGNYVALCFVTDPKTHLPHAALGMIMPFTAQ
jgi:hypothetical protein